MEKCPTQTTDDRGPVSLSADGGLVDSLQVYNPFPIEIKTPISPKTLGSCMSFASLLVWGSQTQRVAPASLGRSARIAPLQLRLF